MDLWAMENPLKPPPGTGPTYRFEGPWFQTQLALSLSLGVSSFLLFCFLRPRYTLLYAPRTKLKGFSPQEAHAQSSHRPFSWIGPTLRTSEFTVLQVVGLDAAVLLSFFKLGFIFFSSCAVAAACILMPFNYKLHGSVDSQPEDDNPDNRTDIWRAPTVIYNGTHGWTPNHNGTTDNPTFLDILMDPTTSLTLHLLFTILFSLLALYFARRNFTRFIRSRQLFSLELVHSISARTVLCSNLPNHLRGDRALAAYFEDIGWPVESVSVCRSIAPLTDLLDRRTSALLALERAWSDYVGNPAKNGTPPAYKTPLSLSAPEAEQPEGDDGKPARFEIPGKPRPMIREGGKWWAVWRNKVDALDYWERQFAKADEAVKRKRRTGKFEATGSAFVTFENMADAQIATQAIHSPSPDKCITVQAPEPRDIVWSNVGRSEGNRWARDIVIMTLMALLLLFWQLPVATLASLLSYKEIKRVLPRLAKIINRSPHTRAFVQNSLPAFALLGFNAILPYLLEAFSYEQGFQARSWVEYSLLKKYFLFLLVSIIFVWNATASYWDLVLELAGDPSKIPSKLPSKLALSLSAGPARHFFMSYVMLQALGTMPLQLLNVGTIASLAIFRLFWTRTPRDFAELNAPPMLNYGTVYPQAILVFIITLMYSVVSPLILVFGAAYFGMGYLVYKYKLLFVFYKPYESSGQAWPITFSQLLLGVVLFQLFMTGLFTLQGAFYFSFVMAPLIAGTIYWAHWTYGVFRPLCSNVSLSLLAEVQRGEAVESVMRVGRTHEGETTRAQTNLNRRRYAINQEDLYLAPADARTDYSQPPMGGYFSGVLNTGRRRYVHPALAGVLPSPWYPRAAEESLESQATTGMETSTPSSTQADLEAGTSARADSRKGMAVVLSLRRKVGRLARKAVGNDAAAQDEETPLLQDEPAALISPAVAGAASSDGARNPWSDTAGGRSGESYRDEPTKTTVGRAGTTSARMGPGLSKRLSFDPTTGVIVLSDADDNDDEPEEDDIPSSSGTPSSSGEEHDRAPREFQPYYPGVERRRTLSRSQQPPPAGL